MIYLWATVSQFLKIAELNEGHRVSSLSWGKFYRTIKTELTRHPLDRMAPLEMIKISRDEYKANDERARIKAEINKELESNIKEVKQHKL